MSTSVLCVRAHVQDREYMHVWVTVRTVSCFVSSLFGVWTNHLLLAMIPHTGTLHFLHRLLTLHYLDGKSFPFVGLVCFLSVAGLWLLFPLTLLLLR